MTDPSSLRDEIDLDAWEVDDLPDAFADAVLDAIEAGGEAQTIAPSEVRPAPARSRGWIALGSGALAAAAVVALWWGPQDAPSPATFDGVTATAEDDDAGAMKLSSPQRAVMSDVEAPREVRPPEPVNEAYAVSPTPKPDWSAARVGIRKALDARAAAAREAQPGDGDPERDEGSGPALGTLDKDYIRNTVREDVVPLVRECYNDLLEKAPATDGRMVLKFTIMGDESVGGIVEEMEFGEDSEIRDEGFRECVAETMRSTVFAPPEGGGVVVVTYPFIFTTDPDAEARVPSEGSSAATPDREP